MSRFGSGSHSAVQQRTFVNARGTLSPVQPWYKSPRTSVDTLSESLCGRDGGGCWTLIRAEKRERELSVTGVGQARFSLSRTPDHAHARHKRLLCYDAAGEKSTLFDLFEAVLYRGRFPKP